MNIYGKKVRSAAFGTGIITEQSESTVTIDFNGEVKKFLYPSGFEGYLVAEDPAIQREIHSEIASEKARTARRQRTERRRAMMLAEQQKIEAQKPKPKRKR